MKKLFISLIALTSVHTYANQCESLTNINATALTVNWQLYQLGKYHETDFFVEKSIEITSACSTGNASEIRSLIKDYCYEARPMIQKGLREYQDLPSEYRTGEDSPGMLLLDAAIDLKKICNKNK